MEREPSFTLDAVAVTYTVKELLARIEAELIRSNAENKAAIESLGREHREAMSELSRKVDKLESVRDKMVGFAFAVGAISGGAAGWLANLIQGG